MRSVKQKLHPVQDREVLVEISHFPTNWPLEQLDQPLESLDPFNPFDPFEPLNPRKRRPMPKRPFEVALRETG